MTMFLVRVSEEQLESYVNDGESFLQKYFDDEDYDSDADESHLDLDKSWDGVLYSLTGFSSSQMEKASQPALSVLFGENQIEETDCGYGPAFYSDAENVKIIQQFLVKLDVDSIRKNYDGKKMNDADVYPGGWDNSGEIDWIMENIWELTSFYTKAANENQCIISMVS